MLVQQEANLQIRYKFAVLDLDVMHCYLIVIDMEVKSACAFNYKPPLYSLHFWPIIPEYQALKMLELVGWMMLMVEPVVFVKLMIC